MDGVEDASFKRLSLKDNGSHLAGRFFIPCLPYLSDTFALKTVCRDIHYSCAKGFSTIFAELHAKRFRDATEK